MNPRHQSRLCTTFRERRVPADGDDGSGLRGLVAVLYPTAVSCRSNSPTNSPRSTIPAQQVVISTSSTTDLVRPAKWDRDVSFGRVGDGYIDGFGPDLACREGT